MPSTNWVFIIHEDSRYPIPISLTPALQVRCHLWVASSIPFTSYTNSKTSSPKLWIHFPSCSSCGQQIYLMLKIPHLSPPHLSSVVKHDCAPCPPVSASWGPAIKVCLAFGLFAMLRQSNLAPPMHKLFDPSRHTCQGGVLEGPP